MNWLLVGAVATLLAAGYLSALNIALLRSRRAALISAMEMRDRPADGQWLVDHLDPLMQAVALLRTLARMGFFVLVLAEIVGIGNPAGLTWRNLVLSGAVAGVLLWLVTAVIAAALARHVGVGLIVSGMPVLRSTYFVTWPLTRTVSFVDEAVRRLTGANLRDQEEEAEAELLRSIEDTHREGALPAEAAMMLENVVEFTNTDVGEIMTPRTDIEGVELTDDLSTIRGFIQSAGHSRIPVYKQNLDEIVGILYVKDLIRYLGQDAADFHLQPLLRQPIVVPETKKVSELLADFQHSEVHMAIVIDEYGGTAGLVTIEDVLEEIVGEIQDEHEAAHDVAPGLRTIDERRSEVDGRFRVYDLNERLGLHLPEDAEYDTMAGFVVAHLGRVPTAGESLEAHGARFTVLQAAPTHVQRIGVELLEAPSPSGTEAALRG